MAGGGSHTIALKDGVVLAWGNNGQGQCNIPASANSGVSAIAGGYAHTIALSPFKDCNNNGIHDPLDIAAGSSDLNHDWTPDSCFGAVDYNTTSPSLGVPTANVPVNYTFTNLVMPDNFADVPLTITARGDFDAANEFLTIKLNGVIFQRVFETAVNCSVNSNAVTVNIPFATFANAVALGQLTITLLPSPAVTGSECANGFMTVQIQFVGIGASGDCDNNGLLDTRDIGANAAQDRDMNSLLDSCQIHANPLLDRNNNGVLDSWDVAVDPTLDCNRNFLIDIYEIVDAPNMDCNFNNIIDTCDIAAGSSDDDLDNHPDQCQYDKGDLDLSGNIDLGDVGILLLYMGEVNPAFGDMDGNGVIDYGDVGYVALNFGPVTWP